MPYEAIVAGHLALDFLPDMSSLPSKNVINPGKVFEIGPMLISTGGAVSNTGLALYRLGINVGLISAVGDDWIGQLILDYMRSYEEALVENIAVIADAASAYTVVIEPHQRDRTLLTNNGANDIFSLDSIDLDMVAACKLFHLGYPTLLPRLYQDDGAGLLAVLRAVKDIGRITSIDMSLPSPDHPSGQVDWLLILQRCLPYVDIFIPSIEEILYMLRRDDYESWQAETIAGLTPTYLGDLAQELLDLGVGIAGFKLGERGFYLRTAADRERLAFLSTIAQSPQQWAGKETWHPAFQVKVAGTTGAGDAAYAGFLAALIRGLDYQACARWACGVAACNIEAADATSGVRGWDDTKQRLASDWETV